jgi:ATP/maltotriose-dependent transcriptional regulator MalT
MQTVTGSGAVVEAKLYPGSGVARVLQRPKLALPREFREGSVSVVAVCAPAGYGKSTLMSCWHEALSEAGFGCGWLSLDPDDDDPARLMRHLVAAFQRIDKAIGRSAMGELTANVSGSVKPALESLAADLSQLGKRAVLFLDDLQFLTASEATDLIDWLINFSPRQCQYVLGGRAEPQVKLGGLRVRGRLAEYGVRELQFTSEESEQFFESRLGPVLGSDEVQQLLKRTEGWPAALELAALALRAETDHAEIVKRFAGSDRDVVDYLGEAVLNGLDARTRGFIMRLAHFDRFSAELAEAVTDEFEAAGLLAAVHANNLFLVPLDRTSQWFRFHHLAAEFLRHRFHREGGDAAAVLLAGAQWLYRNGHPEDAINAAIRAESWETATRWVAESAEELIYRRGYHQTILRWMMRLPPEWVDRFPTIRIHYAFALAFTPRHQEVEAQVHRLEAIRTVLSGEPGSDSQLIQQIECEIELQKVLSLGLRDDGHQARAGAQDWLDRWPDAPLIRRGTMGNVLTFGLKTAGDIDTGLEWNRRVRAWLRQAEGWYSLSWADYLAALLHMKRGSYLEARQYCESGLTLLREKLDSQPAQSAMFHSVLATVAYEFDELDQAQTHLEQALPRVMEYGQADSVLMGFLTAAKLDRVQRGEEIGLERLREGQEVGAQRGFARVTLSLAAEECGWHSRAGRYEEARRIAVRHGFEQLECTGPTAALQSGKAVLVSSRFLMRQSPRDVLARVDVPIARCRTLGMYRRWVELLLIKAMAYKEDGQLPQAVEAFKDALIIAAPRNYFRTIFDEAPDVGTLIERLDPVEMRGSEASPLARRLRQALKDQSNGQARRSEPKLIEDLSRREVSILKRLESDLSNKEIAQAIFISEGTLKWHLHNIYGKLGVKNRSGAIVKAKALSVI